VIVTNDPEDDLPLAMEGGVVVDDGGKGGGKKRKVVTAEDVAPRYSREERLAPMRDLLRSLLENQRGTTSSSSSAAAAAAALDDETIDGMGFGDLRDVVLASGNMLDPDHIRRVNRAKKEFWIKSQGMEIAPSDEKGGGIRFPRDARTERRRLLRARRQRRRKRRSRRFLPDE